jgi:ribonucleotide monophosphatase NagD (HAD superfamily)
MAGLAVISDMDGVVYRGREAVPGAQEFIDRLRGSDTRSSS